MQQSPIARELGTALAVLAIYVLTMLAPLHQAAAAQREFARLGFETIGQWSICSETVQKTGDLGDKPPAVKCPVAGGGKLELVHPQTAQVTFPRVSGRVVSRSFDDAGNLCVVGRVNQPRAPPLPA